VVFAIIFLQASNAAHHKISGASAASERIKALEEWRGAVKEQLLSILPKMQRFARTLTGSRDDADDLVQQACERFLRKPESSNSVTCLESWMYRVIHNAWIDEKRSMRTKISDPLEAGLDVAGENGEHVVGIRSTLARVRLEMARLPAEQRAALMLVCVDGLSYQDAAGILSIPVGTLMSRLSRARLALAASLRHSDQGETSRKNGKAG
jgi:RNA polymerase sigma-70 factor (ECF subfamily)